MHGFDPSAYGRHWAGVYDDWYPPLTDDDPMVVTLADLTGDGAALELGVGTGRVALPLTRRGIEVHGIDASGEMLERLHAKAGADEVPVTVGDITEVDVGRRFSLVFGVFNVVFNLLTQEAQVRLFENAARHLEPGGALVIETFVPDPERLGGVPPTTARRVEADEVVLNATRHDPVEQRIDSALVVLRADGTEILPVPIRYAWPAELDLMARLAGLRLRARWDDWRRAPFTAGGGFAVSVYEPQQTSRQQPSRRRSRGRR